MPINNFVIATEPLPAELLSRINRDNVSMSDTLVRDQLLEVVSGRSFTIWWR